MVPDGSTDGDKMPISARHAGFAAGLALALTLAGCGGGDGGSDEPAGPQIGAAIVEPADTATGVPTATEIVVSTDNATEATVELTELDGASVDGELTPDGTTWRPAGQLEYETTYVATLTAVGDGGETKVATSTFTTMAEPDQTIRVFSFLGPDARVGVGMPLRIEFKDDGDALRQIPEEDRAEIERRMSVRSDPPQVGSWHWVSGAELHYRPKDYWQPGTQINYSAVTGGLPISEGRYLRNDLNINVTVGPAIVMEADAGTRQLTVSVDGEVQRQIPISLGRSDYPSSSGTFLIMEKFRETVFDTREELGPDDGYRVDIEYAMRLTYGGEFIHAAVPGRSDVLGAENVTHGCMNMAKDNAQWLFDLTHNWGDPVTVTGTGERVETGNGWTDWNLSWEEYQRGSALHNG
jgi:lipoprotein-anchoring transpeptidase ErfK/SrfK